MDRLAALHDAGVSIWLDTLSRELLESNDFDRLVKDCQVTGATSNPTIFAKAITSGDRYDTQLAWLVTCGLRDARELFFCLALEDVRRAADVLRPIYEHSEGADGFVSFECTPDLADDTAATITQARDLWNRLQRPNTMIKVPGNTAGIPAIERLTAEGININVTLLFSVDRYRQVLDAYQAGLEARLRNGKPVDRVTSIASFFVSRVDTKVNQQLPHDSWLRGRAAIANAAVAFATYQRAVRDKRWRDLASAGARTQRPLWASTGTKNDDYSDVLYVGSLVAPDVANTMPQATLDAFADHGRTAATIVDDDTMALGVHRGLARAGIDLEQITAEHEREGVKAFCYSYNQLLVCIEQRVREFAPPPRPRRNRPMADQKTPCVRDEALARPTSHACAALAPRHPPARHGPVRSRWTGPQWAARESLGRTHRPTKARRR